MEDFEKRMVVEYKQLEERRDKLNAFLNYDDNAEKREGICEGELGEMHKQLEAMDRYIEALGARLQIRGICYNGFTDEELVEFGYVKRLKGSNQLTKNMAVNLLKGTYPNFDVMDKIPRELGELVSAPVRHWEWNDFNETVKYTTEELYELYLLCENSWCESKNNAPDTPLEY